MRNLFKNNAFIFLLIVLVSLVFKVQYLDRWGFWQDETFSLYFSQQHWGHLKHISEWDINAPLYYYFLWIWQHLFGISEYSIRFSSALFSSLAAGMMWLLCARHFNKTCGWLAVLLFTVSNEMYFYAHEGRPYSLILFFVLCSTWFFFELLRKSSWINAVALGILNFGLIYTHYVSGLILVIQAALVLVQFNKTLFKFMGTALGVTLLIAFLRFTKKTIERILQNEQFVFWVKPGASELTEEYYSFFNGPDLFYIFLVAALIGVFAMVRNKEWKPAWTENKFKLLYIWLAGPGTIIICFFLSWISPFFVKRYLLFAGPCIYLTFAWFISRADSEVRYPLMAIIGLFLAFSFMRINLQTPKGMDYRSALYLVKALHNDKTPVFVESRDMGPLFSYYYDREIFKDYGNIESRMAQQGVHMAGNLQDVKVIDLYKTDRLVLTQTYEEFTAEDKQMQQYLSENFRQKITTKFYPGVTISVYAK